MAPTYPSPPRPSLLLPLLPSLLLVLLCSSLPPLTSGVTSTPRSSSSASAPPRPFSSSSPNPPTSSSSLPPPILSIAVSISLPFGLVYDGLYLYVSDSSYSNQILQLTPGGVQVGVLQVPDPVPYNSIELGGMSLDSANFLYVADPLNNRIVKLARNGTAVGVFSPTITDSSPYRTFIGPLDVAIGPSDHIFVADSLPGRVVELFPNGTVRLIIEPISNLLAYPFSVAVDSGGVVYVGDGVYGGVIKRSVDGTTTLFISQQDVFARALALDSMGFLFVSDEINSRVIRVNPSGMVLANFTASSPALYAPTGLALDGTGNLFVADCFHGRLVEFVGGDSSTRPTSSFFTSPPGTSSSASSSPVGTQVQTFPMTFQSPWGVVCDGLGHVYVSDVDTTIYKFTTNGTAVVGFTAPVGLHQPSALAIDSSGSIYVADSGNDRIVKFSSTGEQMQVFTTINPALYFPLGVAIDSYNNIWIADTMNNRIVQLYPNGTQGEVVTTANPSLNQPFSVTVDQASNLYIADVENNRVIKRYPNGTLINLYSGAGAAGVIVDWLGNVWIADTNANRVVELSPTGQVKAVLTATPTFYDPQGLALDGLGNLFVTDLLYPTGGNVVKFIGVALPNPLSSSSSAVTSSLSSTKPTSTSSTASSSTVSSMDRTSSSSSTASLTSTASGSLCVLLYGAVGTVDYPWSSALWLSFAYNPLVVPGSVPGSSAVRLLNGTGSRTYVNRFGASFTTPLTLHISGNSSEPNNLLYLNSTSPVDGIGLTWLMGSPTQLPGSGPSSLSSFIELYNASGVLVEGGWGELVDPFGQSFLSSIPGFLNQTLPASNVNSLSVSYSQCSAPITFTNGLRQPTQPSASNGAVHLSYSYYISDHTTYSVLTNLSITTSSAFATTKDQLGSPYQTIITVTGLSNSTTTPGPSQRFYPYALLSSAPGVYSMNTAPFIDGDGIGLTVTPAIPLNGAPLGGSGTQYNVLRLQLTSLTAGGAPVLTDAPYSTNAPLISAQLQTYQLL